MTKKLRGKAFSGKGYGTMRRKLQEAARDRIEQAISLGFWLEAIALEESLLTERLESRVSFLRGEDTVFLNLGAAVHLAKKHETDPAIKLIIPRVDEWRALRNQHLHELVKVAAVETNTEWSDKMKEAHRSALSGYLLAKQLYHLVADLNPRHKDRVFHEPQPELDELRGQRAKR